MSGKRFRARSKKVTKLGRDGLVEQDRATGEEQRVSQRTADISFGPKRDAASSECQNAAKSGKRTRGRARQKQRTPEIVREQTEPRTPERSDLLMRTDDAPLTCAPPDGENRSEVQRKRQRQPSTRLQLDASQRLTFEQSNSDSLQFEPERGTDADTAMPEADAREDGVSVPRGAHNQPMPRYVLTKSPQRQTQRHTDGGEKPRLSRGESQNAPAPGNPKAVKRRQAAEHTPDAAKPERARLRFEDTPKKSDMLSDATVTPKRRSATSAEQFTQSKRSRERPTQSKWAHNGDAVKARRRLRFEEEAPKDAPKPKSSGVSPGRAVRTAALIAVHGKLQDAEDGNVAVEAAHESGIIAEHGAGNALRWQRSRRQMISPSRTMRRTERQERPQFHSNPISRWQQKQAIKRQYAAAKRAGTQQTAARANQTVARAAEAVKTKTAAFVRRHKKGFLILGGIILVIAMCSSLFTSCSTLIQGGASAVTATIYPSEDADMLAAEAWYIAKEAVLQAYLDTYEDTHAYNEYHYELDDIEHDPYVLISMLTALQGGAWTVSEVQDALQMLFDRQYILTETVTTETRTRTVNGEEQAYTYYKCTVKLENTNLSHLPIYIMGEDQLSMYAAYMGTLGNRPDLFPDSGYISKYLTQGYTDYEIPASALEDETFAAMIAEAEKYLGYPYVWGGSNPNTSFDCSGFVSWIINHSGWNVGRLGAQSLYNICTPTNNPRPGDLIFFTGTFAADTPVTHVGLYVGDGWMIHAGDPISYASVNSNYFRAHFYAYGRLP